MYVAHMHLLAGQGCHLADGVPVSWATLLLCLAALLFVATRYNNCTSHAACMAAGIAYLKFGNNRHCAVMYTLHQDEYHHVCNQLQMLLNT